MNKFLRTGSILDEILEKKVEEVAIAKQSAPLATVRELSERVSPAKDFRSALHKDTVALIAEVKKASPSKGVMMPNFNHMVLASAYAANGASAISVLTDEQYFQGHLRYLKEISKSVDLPTLRKDFIIDPYQVYEARMARASAVLLIVAALEDSQLADLYAIITELGMTALVEIHNEDEFERAMKINPTVIGVNNRNLKTFKVDLATIERVADLIPDDVTLIAESGLKTPEDVAHMGAIGAHAVLIGEGLVTSGNIPETVQAFSSQQRG
ncbi:MAG: indole-3-glycerol phosphate synthase TrpC [Chloroflexota bacterium]